MLKCIKLFSPRKSVDRGLLCDGFIVLRMRGIPPPSAVDEFMGPDSDDDGAVALAECNYKMLHVAAINLSPYTPVFQELYMANEGDGVVGDCGRSVNGS